MSWTERDIPSLAGRTAVVTGANSGLGFVTALELYRAGADVVLAVRNTGRGEQARDRIELAGIGSAGSVTVAELDLSDLTSVAAFAQAWAGPLDILVANAGIMMVPRRELTVDGFESQMGTNHFGHFALIGRLFPQLAVDARVVSLSSMAHRGAGPLNPGLGLLGEYTPMGAYSQSKLANGMFALGLHRRVTAAGSQIRSVAAHPGWCATDLFNRDHGDDPGFGVRVSRRASAVLGSPVRHGVRSQLRAATDPTVPGGSYVGPRFLIRGAPVLTSFARPAYDLDDARWLWTESAALTGVEYPLPENLEKP